MMLGKNFPVNFLLGARDIGAGKAFKKTSKQIRTMNQRIAGFGKTMSLTATPAMLGLGTAAAASAVKFNKSMASVSTLIDTNVESMEAMKSKVLEIGKKTPVAMGDLTATLYDIRSAGVSAADQFKVLEKSAQLGVAGLGSTKEAADLVTSAINSFQLKGKEAEAVYGQIFATVKSGKTDISQLAQGFGEVAGMASGTGVSLSEYLASVAAITSTGTKAAQAHTKMKSTMSGLMGTSKELLGAYEELGAKGYKDLIAKSGGLVPALAKLRGAFKGNEVALKKALGGADAFNTVMDLTGNLAGAQAGAMKSMANGSQLLADGFAKQNATTAAALQRSKNNIEASSIKIGEKLLPILEKAADKVAKLADWFGKLDDSTQTAIVGFGAALMVIGPLATAISAAAAAAQLMNAAFASQKAMQLAGGIKTLTLMTKASIPVTRLAGITAKIAAGPWLALAAAVAAVSLAIDQFMKLDAQLGEVGISGTLGEMWDQGTLDIFKANDDLMNRNAKKRRAEMDAKAGLKSKAAEAAAGTGTNTSSETKIAVEVKGPPGTRAGVVKKQGPQVVDITTGIAMQPGN